MKIKNVLKSEECQDLRVLIGLTNTLITKVNEIETKTETNDFVEIGKKMREVQMELCKLLGGAANRTLLAAQGIEAEVGEEITQLSRPKPTEK